jgi:anaerobic magnesium-protoporphyrin IX monomethyl ester cyclase
MQNVKVALLTLTEVDLGILSLSGILKGKGIDCRLIGLCNYYRSQNVSTAQEIADSLFRLIEDFKFIGFSVLDIYFEHSIELAAKIKDKFPNKVVFFGGIHAELYPSECMINTAVDAVCICDGYNSIIDLIQKWDIRDEVDIINFNVRLETGKIKLAKSVEVLTSEEINELPMPDYTFSDYWAYDPELKKLDLIVNKKSIYDFAHHQVGHKNSFVSSFMDGCSNKCTYCNNWARVNIHEKLVGHRVEKIRYKTVRNMITEIESILRHHQVDFFVFLDNDFLYRTEEELSVFSRQYESKIKLPFYIMAYPDSISEIKIKHLAKCGLKELNIGIQSCEKVNYSLYNRRIEDKSIIDIAILINKFVEQCGINVFYDFIINNPATSSDEILDTIRLIRKLPSPFDQVNHNLTLGPGVPLYHYFVKRNIPLNNCSIYHSDFHIFTIEDILSLKSGYYNVVMRWMDGRHDQQWTGRIKRKSIDFIEQINKEELNHYDAEIMQTLLEKAKVNSETIDLLLDEDVRGLMNANNEIVLLIDKYLPATKYSNAE